MSEGNQDKREDPQDLQSDRTQTDNESGDPARLAPANSRLTDVPAGVIAAVAVHGLLFSRSLTSFSGIRIPKRSTPNSGRRKTPPA